jgi:molybdenum cofactor cytidylyltransferase
MSQEAGLPLPTVGVLLAAGRSSRMGTNKALLPWGVDDETTVVAAAFDVLGHCPCHLMFVTLGHEADDVREALGDRRFTSVTVEPDAPMFESIRAAIRAMGSRRRDCHGVWLHTVDAPAVSPRTIEAVTVASEAHPKAVVLPEHEGRGGHPVFIPQRFLDRIERWQGEGGLREFWRTIAKDVIRLPVDDAAVTMDLDTPAEYEKARRVHQSRQK